MRKKDTVEARGGKYTIPQDLSVFPTDYIVVGPTSSDLQRDTGITKYTARSVSPGLKRRRRGGGGGGIEHLDAVYAWAAYTTILCCMNTVNRRVLCPLSPIWGYDREFFYISSDVYYSPFTVPYNIAQFPVPEC